MQPYFLPYLGYFQLLDAADIFVLYDDVQFIKGGWISRNFVQVAKAPHRIAVGMQGASSNKLINEVGVSDDFVKLRKTISMAYARAPQLAFGESLVDEVLGASQQNLARFVGAGIERVAHALEATASIVYSSELDYDRGLVGQQRLLALCASLGTTTYVNSAGGRHLYQKEAFREHGIELTFLSSHPPEYRQFDDEFVPGLSVLDAFMFVDRGTVASWMSRYVLD